MKKYLAIAFFLALLACKKNQSPVCSIKAPTDGQFFELGETITISAEAMDPDGDIDVVWFYVNGVLLAEDLVYPYNYSWQTYNENPGHFILKIRAYDFDQAYGEAEIGVDLISGASQ